MVVTAVGEDAPGEVTEFDGGGGNGGEVVKAVGLSAEVVVL